MLIYTYSSGHFCKNIILSFCPHWPESCRLQSLWSISHCFLQCSESHRDTRLSSCPPEQTEPVHNHTNQLLSLFLFLLLIPCIQRQDLQWLRSKMRDIVFYLHDWFGLRLITQPEYLQIKHSNYYLVNIWAQRKWGTAIFKQQTSDAVALKAMGFVGIPPQSRVKVSMLLFPLVTSVMVTLVLEPKTS